MSARPARRRLVPLLLGAGFLTACTAHYADMPPTDRSAATARTPLVVAHRGASGYRPEHTLESYRLAIEQGADFIEPDLVATRDGVLVARHEPNITDTTDVAARPEFASRRTTRVVDGRSETGWFTVDFTLAELKTLRAVQPRPYRPQEFNGRFEVPTFDEVIALARAESARRGRTIGVYPETKHPTWHCELGLPLEPALLDALARNGWRDRDAPVIVQSFETGNLRWLRPRTGVRLMQLVDGDGVDASGRVKPAPRWSSAGGCALFPLERPPQAFEDETPFREIARYADIVGPWKRWILGATPENRLAGPTRFVELAHRAGLQVHTWTFRNEAEFLAADYGGDPAREYLEFYALGIDGLFSDFPDTALAARERFLATRR